MLLLELVGEAVLDGDGGERTFSKPTYRSAESSTVVGKVDARFAVAVVDVVDGVVDVDGRKDVRVGCGEVGFSDMLYTRCNERHSCNGWPLRRHKGQEYRLIRDCTSLMVKFAGLYK